MRWSQNPMPIADAVAIRDNIDTQPGKPPQEVLDRNGNPIPGAPEISEVAIFGSEANPGQAYVGVDSAWAIGQVNTLYPGVPFAPDGEPPGP